MSVRHGSCPQRRARTLPGIRAGALLLATAVAVGFGSAPAGADSAPSPASSLPTPSQSATTSTSAASTSAASTSTASTSTASSSTASTRTVSYGGVSVQVPAAWRVVDLDKTPGACVRLDVATIYTGAASEQQNCPAHLVGRADTLWLAPSATTSDAPRAKIGTMAARRVADTTAHQELAAITGRKVVIKASWGASRTAIDAALSTVSGTSGSVPAAALAAAGRSPGARAAAVLPSAPGASTHATGPTASPAAFTGLGMDTCSAPSISSLNAWKSSPYRAVGIYLGGANRACGDGNLSASWVSSVTASGWGLIPIYVGLQAPCVQQNGTSVISSSAAATQGTAAANDAIAKARTFGIPTGRPIYNDMENYATGDSSCRTAVLNFLSAWSATLHRSGYLSGVYGGPGSVMSDMANAGTGFVAPDHVWFAAWNGRADVRAESSYPRFPDAKWADHQRLHQFVGNTSETWGGVRIYIDANWVDATLAGNAVPVSYGTRTTGPVGARFAWTGPMSSWHPIIGQGLGSHAQYTGSSGTSTEVNGATWSMPLAAGTYSALAYLPPSYSSGKARYTITAPGVSTSSVINQAGTKGYRPVGSFTLRSAATVVVHVGDNGGSPAGTPLATDAMSFRLDTPPPPPPVVAPGAVSAVNATVVSGASSVSWQAPKSGGPVSTYVVTASPGGRSATVPGSSRTATVSGLTNGTSYTFGVVAKNSGGASAAARSAAVIPTASTPVTVVTPTRLVDTTRGTSANPGAAAIAAGSTRSFRIGGAPGSPIPMASTAAYLRVTVQSGAATGYLSTSAGVLTFGASDITSSTRLFPLSGARVTITNRSTRAIHLTVDAQGYSAATGTRLNATAATRLADTRTGNKINSRKTAIPAGGSVQLRVAGVSGSPVPAGAPAALLNLTAIGPGAGGYLSATNGIPALNFTAKRTVAASSLLRLSSNGTVTIANHSSRSLHILLDVEGYLGASGTKWTTVTPRMIFSSTAATGTAPHPVSLAKGASVRIPVRAVYGSPVPANAAAVMVAMRTWTASTTASVGTSPSSGSVLNFTARLNSVNVAVLPIDGSGYITFINRGTTSLQLTVDLIGYAGPA